MFGISDRPQSERRPFVEYEPVLSILAEDKLTSYSLIKYDPDRLFFWDIKPLPFDMVYLPYIKFHEGKIPLYFNHTGIAIYLGFTQAVAENMFTDLYLVNMSNPTRSEALEAVHNHIDAKWAARTHTGTAIGTPMATTMMTQAGLTPEVQAEVNILYSMFERNAGVFQDYLDNHPGKMAESLQMVDFIHELINQRMKKLEKLDDAIIRMLH